MATTVRKKRTRKIFTDPLLSPHRYYTRSKKSTIFKVTQRQPDPNLATRLSLNTDILNFQRPSMSTSEPEPSIEISATEPEPSDEFDYSPIGRNLQFESDESDDEEMEIVPMPVKVPSKRTTPQYWYWIGILVVLGIVVLGTYWMYRPHKTQIKELQEAIVFPSVPKEVVIVPRERRLRTRTSFQMVQHSIQHSGLHIRKQINKMLELLFVQWKKMQQSVSYYRSLLEGNWIEVQWKQWYQQVEIRRSKWILWMQQDWWKQFCLCGQLPKEYSLAGYRYCQERVMDLYTMLWNPPPREIPRPLTIYELQRCEWNATVIEETCPVYSNSAFYRSFQEKLAGMDTAPLSSSNSWYTIMCQIGGGLGMVVITYYVIALCMCGYLFFIYPLFSKEI